ncbi:hypothetical protein QBC32DRAFT_207388 [Pseudoneurospora amorphoporcata]|uniref:Large ribosomal subunit protein uL23m n=1 Tax=Pseudoneurospora amorphoporcata TaxID=241081 RepID=A0AAN6P0R3_9PEZI|nr:hypothetical protein QBC32DRAFT_207388 [Pseudoneurospora amorphoporcata]
MASVAKMGAEALRNAPFRVGKKQIFLPNHVITFVRPLPKQPPNLATFIVPLEFNKLDLRDYLYHVYNVEVTGVRSFVNQRMHEQRHGEFGNWRRPKSQKMMIAELAKPFVWPKPPAEEARDGFDYSTWKKQNKAQEDEKKYHAVRTQGEMTVPSQHEVSKDRKAIKAQQSRLLSGEETWAPGKVNSFLNSKIVPEEEGWSEVEENLPLDESAEESSSKGPESKQ